MNIENFTLYFCNKEDKARQNSQQAALIKS